MIRVLPENRPDAVADRVDSWKDIAAYLRRDVSTVQRWEKREGLPIHRIPHDKQGSVYAFKSELDEWLQRGRVVLEPTVGGTASPWLPAIVGMMIAVVVLAAAWWMATTSATNETRADVVRSTIPLPADAANAFDLAFSPDSSRLAYVGVGQATSGLQSIRRLYLRRISELTSTPLAGTEGAGYPFFSPDGTWIAFFANGRLKKIAVSGGAPITLAPAPDQRGGTWGSDNSIVYAPLPVDGLWRVSASGGNPVRITAPNRDAHERSHRYPSFLPDGRTVLFTLQRAGHDSFDDAEIEALRLDTGERILALRGGMAATYVPSGHLVYARRGALFAARFDVRRIAILGTSIRVADRVFQDPSTGAAAFAASGAGALLYAVGESPALRRLMWVEHSGSAHPVVEDRRAFLAPRVSPDGNHIAVTVDEGVPRVWLLDVRRGTLRPRSGIWDAGGPFWSPDGRRLGYMGINFEADSDHNALRMTSHKPMLMSRDGTDPGIELTATRWPRGSGAVSDWSPDGRFAAVHSGLDAGDIDLLSLDGKGGVRQLVTGPAFSARGRFSPNGRFLAFNSDDAGHPEIYVRELAGENRQWQVSVGGGVAPVWARNGRELLYRTGQRVMAVDVSITDYRFSASKPRLLLDGPFLGGVHYDVAPDGRLLMIELAPESSPTELVLVQNWVAEFRGLR